MSVQERVSLVKVVHVSVGERTFSGRGRENDNCRAEDSLKRFELHRDERDLGIDELLDQRR